MEINNILSGNAYDATSPANAGKTELKAADAFMSLLNNVDIKGADFQYSFTNILDNLTPVREKAPEPEAKNTDLPAKPKANKKAKAEPEPKDNAYAENAAQPQTESVKKESKAEVSYTAAPSENNSDYTPTPNETEVGKPTPKSLQTPEAGLQKEGATVPSLNGEDLELDANAAKNASLQNEGEVLVANQPENTEAILEDDVQVKAEVKPVTTSPLLEKEKIVSTDMPEKPIVLSEDIVKTLPETADAQETYFPESEIKVDANTQDKTLLNSDRMPETTSLNVKAEETSEPVVAKSILDTQKQRLASLIGKDEAAKTEVKVQVTQEALPEQKTETIVKEAVLEAPKADTVKVNAETSVPVKKAETDTKEYTFERTEGEGEAEAEMPLLKTETKNTAKPVNSTLNEGQFLKEQNNLNTVKTTSLLSSGAENQATSAVQNFTSQLKAGAVKAEAVNGIDAQTATNAKATPMQAAAIAEKADTLAKTVNAQKTAQLPKQVRQNIIDQIKVDITKAANKENGLDKIKINLKPRELGSIEVKMEVGNNGHLKTSITATRPETLDALQRDVRVLERALADAGFDIKDNSLSFQLRGENQQQGQQQFADDNRQGTFANTEENLIQDNEPELFAEDVIREDENGLYAVNIKV